MAKNMGFAARCNGFFLTKKGEFMPLSDATMVKESADMAVFEAEKRLGGAAAGIGRNRGRASRAALD